MKCFLRIIISFLMLINIKLKAENYSNRSYLVTRAPGKDLYLRETGWYSIKRSVHSSRKANRGTFQIIPFFQKLLKPFKTGAYFGVKEKSTISYKNNAGDVDVTAMLHDAIYDGFEINDTQNFSYTNTPIPFTRKYKYVKPSASQPLGDVVKITNDDTVFNGIIQVIADRIGITTSNFDPATKELFRNFYDSTDLLTTIPEKESQINYLANEFAKIADNRALVGELTLKPERKTWGALLSYHYQTIDAWWIELHLPILAIKQNFIPEITNEQHFNDGKTRKNISIKDLISGSYSSSTTSVDNPNMQENLKYAKFNFEEKKTTGIGDIDAVVGFKMFDEQEYDLDLYLRLSLPTAKKNDPEEIFAPQLGNNGHIVIGGGVCGSVELFNFSDSLTGELLFNSNVNYSIKNKQLRTINSYVDANFILPWDKYMLVAAIGKSGPLQPFANVATVEVNVKPGFCAESFASLGIKTNNFVIDIGVSGFFRQGEVVETEDLKLAGKYGHPSNRKYRTDQIYDPNKYTEFFAYDYNSTPIKTFTTSLAGTPGSFSTALFTQAGYAFSNDDDELSQLISFGICYESATENSALSSICCWGKLSLSF